MKLLFSFNQSNLLGECEPTKESVHTRFRALFPKAGTPLIFQRYEKDFDEYVDLISDESYTEIQDKDKLKIIEAANQPQGEQGGQEELSDSDSEAEDGPNTPHPRERLGGKEIPFDYKLPDFGHTVNKMLRKGQAIDITARKLIARKIFKDMRDNYCKDLLPSADEYTRVVDTLLRTYGQLTDIMESGIARNGKRRTRSLTWREGLRRRFKYARSKLVTDKAYKHLQKLQVFNRKNPPAPKGQIDKTQLRRGPDNRHNQNQPPNKYGIGESEATTIQHQTMIPTEWEKPTPNLEVISTRMECSKSIRWYEMRSESLPRIQELYPNLTNGIQWLLEFKRQEGRDLKAARCAFLTQDRQEHILSNLLRTPRPRETRSREDFASSLEEADPSGTQMNAVLGCLPLFVRENVRDWLLVNESVTNAEPIIRVTSKTGEANKFKDAIVIPFLDKAPLVKEETLSIADAFDVLTAAIYLLNAEFNSGSKRSWGLLCAHVYKLELDDEPTLLQQSVTNIMCAQIN